jgi:phage anti-repressor protein
MLHLVIIKEKKHVSSIDLYNNIGMNLTHYSRWVKSWLIPNGIEGEDYVDKKIIRKTMHREEYSITLDFAKELCLKANTNNAKRIRKWIIDEQKKVF